MNIDDIYIYIYISSGTKLLRLGSYSDIMITFDFSTISYVFIMRLNKLNNILQFVYTICDPIRNYFSLISFHFEFMDLHNSFNFCKIICSFLYGLGIS